MMKYFFSRLRRISRPQPVICGQEMVSQWVRDPLSHPTLANMDQRQLADLPFRR